MADDNMTPEERDEKAWNYARRIFNTFDREQEETITVEDLPTVLRLCGMVPTETELEELKHVGDPEATNMVTWENFKSCMTSCMDNYHSEKELTQALQVFVPNEGKSITRTTLRYLLQNYGDKMSDAEINQFFDECPQEFDTDGIGHISEIVGKLFGFLNPPDDLK